MRDVRYSVYSAKDGLPLVLSGTSVQCAKALGLTLPSFYSQSCRQRKGCGRGGEQKYIIVREEEDGGTH